MWTLLDTGLRVSELAGLTRENIDWQSHRVMVYGKGGPYGSKTKRRVIPLTPRILQRLMKRVANRARVSRKVSPHMLRRTFAVTTAQKGISLPALQRLLGHDRLTTTEIYLNFSPEDVVREFMAKW